MSREVIRQDSENHAKNKGIKLNPEKRFVDAIIRGLAMNEEKHGRRFCPCKPLTGDEKQDSKNVCPCETHMEEIRAHGKCHCGLFVGK